MDRLKALPLVVLLGASVALGVWMAWRVLTRRGRMPIGAAVHLILGIAGLEAFVMLRRGAPDGTVAAAGTLSDSAGLTLAVAVLTGLLLSIVARSLKRGALTALLAGHALIGAGGFALLVAWAVAAVAP